MESKEIDKHLPRLKKSSKKGDIKHQNVNLSKLI